MKYLSYSDLMADIDFFKANKSIKNIRPLIENCNELALMMNTKIKSAVKNKEKEIEGRKQLDYVCDFLKLKESIRELEKIELYFDEM